PTPTLFRSHILTAACLVCTVTCRQFLNLTFAPRKTCYIYLNSNLALLRYQCHNICIIQESFWECKGFFVFFQIHFGRKERSEERRVGIEVRAGSVVVW